MEFISPCSHLITIVTCVVILLVYIIARMHADKLVYIVSPPNVNVVPTPLGTTQRTLSSWHELAVLTELRVLFFRHTLVIVETVSLLKECLHQGVLLLGTLFQSVLIEECPLLLLLLLLLQY